MLVRRLIVISFSVCILGCTSWSGARAARPAADPAPEVIAPEDVPSMQVVWSDSQQAPAAKTGFSEAPMPDADVSVPAAPVASTDPQLQPAIYGHKRQFRGDGYAPGSTAQDVQDRSVRPAAGLALNVPLD